MLLSVDDEDDEEEAQEERNHTNGCRQARRVPAAMLLFRNRNWITWSCITTTRSTTKMAKKLCC